MIRFATCASLLVAAALLAAPAGTSAADYPSRPVTVIVPFPAGGSTDSMARAAAREFEDILGTNVAVTNIGGGAGTVGTAQLARARPDGYTIGVVPAAPLINQPHMRETPYSIADFDYICQLFYSPQALAVKPDSPFSTLAEVVDYARAHPNELTYGTPGPGSLPASGSEEGGSIGSRRRLRTSSRFSVMRTIASSSVDGSLESVRMRNFVSQYGFPSSSSTRIGSSTTRTTSAAVLFTSETSFSNVSASRS